MLGVHLQRKKCCWGLRGEHGADGGGAKTRFILQADVKRCQLFTPTAPGTSMALLSNWGLPTAVMRYAACLHEFLVGGVGLDHDFSCC